MHRILALGLRIAKYCWQDLTHYSRCRYYPYQEGQKRSWSAVGGCRGMSRERSKHTIQVGKRQRSVQQHTTSLTVLFTSNSSGVAMFMLTASWQTDLVRFIWWCCLRWTSARNSGCELRVARCELGERTTTTTTTTTSTLCRIIWSWRVHRWEHDPFSCLGLTLLSDMFQNIQCKSSPIPICYTNT